MADDLIDVIRSHLGSDHARGCEGRSYSCTCGHDFSTDTIIRAAHDEIERLRKEKTMDILDRVKEMPSSLNDACRTIEMMADEIELLRAQLAKAEQQPGLYAQRIFQLEQQLANGSAEVQILRDALMNPHPEQEPDNVRLHREKCDALDKLWESQRQLASAKKVLDEIVAIGDKITDLKNEHGIRMGNIAHAAARSITS